MFRPKSCGLRPGKTGHARLRRACPMAAVEGSCFDRREAAARLSRALGEAVTGRENSAFAATARARALIAPASCASTGSHVRSLGAAGVSLARWSAAAGALLADCVAANDERATRRHRARRRDRAG